LSEVAQRTGTTPVDLLRGINQVVFEMGPRRRTVPMGRMFPIDWGWFSPDPRGISKPPEIVGKRRVQSELTEALRGLAAGETVKVGIPQGIASAIPAEGREWESLREFLLSQGFEPTSLDLAGGVPGDVGLVMIAGMGRRLLPDEAAALARYEDQGGRLLLFVDPRKPEDFAGVLREPFGVMAEPALVEDPGRAQPGQSNPAVLLHNELCTGNHEIVRPIGQRIGIYVGVTRPLKVEDLRREGAERTILMQGSPDARVVPVQYKASSGEPDFDFAARKAAPHVPIAAALRRPVAGGKESRIVVFGGWEIVSARPIDLGTHYGNRDLVLNALNWIAERRIAIGIVEREIAPSRVDITQEFMSAFRWITMAALPALLALGGVAVWLSRRN
jgi:hypothetical protein